MAGELSTCPHCGKDTKTIWGACPECGHTKDASAVPAGRAQTWRGEPGASLDDLSFISVGAGLSGLAAIALLVVGLVFVDSTLLIVLGGVTLVLAGGAAAANEFLDGW